MIAAARSGGEVVAKRKKRLWFGYLEAGERSSPVVRDDTIDTGRASTVYLFNWMKGKILEYQKDIVEPKLRDLEAAETGLVPELEKAYNQSRERFTPRGDARPKPTRARKPAPVEPTIDDFNDDEDGSWPPLDDDGFETMPAEMAD